MQVKCQGILLHHFRYGEKGRIIKMFTLEKGIQSFFMYRPSSKKKSQGALEPLSLIEAVYRLDEKRDLQTLKEINVEHPYQSIGRNFLKNGVVLFLNEILLKALKEEQAQEELYHFVREWLVHYDELDYDPNAHLYFLAHITRYLGFSPRLKNEHNFTTFNLRDAVFTTVSEHDPNCISGNTAQLFLGLFGQEYEVVLKAQERQELLAVLLHYYRLHLPGMNDIKSLPILKEVMSA